ncbi:PREDICTED: cytochrome c oxidase subunit 7A2, mitochondrial [Nanorana parkeri]|uniref:cytochrome c oxidase subunit 7A2, mitochondrial n=1 Tax=Nanorana parkeri TaxID=125878 RepID=UPI000854B8F7|nr:PREDICTED: cytochrome c oxidase subunit 7A2, mitochondrial [Nanorana parkeri]
MGSMFRNLLALRQVCQRTLTTSTRKSVQNKVGEKQKLFQEDNGIPIYIKGGAGDILLYRVTMLITGFGTCYALYLIGNASLPPKK